jgi:mono/diheme cytochrome c family protein
MKINRVVVLGAILSFITIHAFANAQKPADLYKSKCQSCHGAGGKATAIGKKLGARDFQDPAVTSMSEDDLAAVTSAGKGKMPAYKGKLTAEQINALGKYIKEMQ